MPKKERSLQPWQVFRAAIKTLSVSELCHIFGKVHIRTIYLYAQDPDCTEQRCKSPLEAIRKMFDRLDEYGRGDVVRAAIAYLSGGLLDESLPDLKDLQPTMAEEILQDYVAVGRLQTLVESGASLAEIEAAAVEANEEINRTVAKCRQDQGKKNDAS